MLLDTITGATWGICDSKDGTVGWCRMLKSEAPPVNPKDPLGVR